MTDIRAFIAESNRIEGIHREPLAAEVNATRHFLDLPELTVGDVIYIVGIYQPNAVIRDRPTLNVRVGNHVAPKGGREIVGELRDLLAKVSALSIDVWAAHVAYETLHPFTDGNGRSGRAIWLWQMEQIVGGTQIGFLHSWYYQTLSRARLTRDAAVTEG